MKATKIHMLQGLNLLLFLFFIGDGHQPNSVGVEKTREGFSVIKGGMSRPPQHRKLRKTLALPGSLDDQDLQFLWPAGFPESKNSQKLPLKVVKHKKHHVFFLSRVGTLRCKTHECFLKINAWGSDAFPIEIYYCISYHNIN